MIPKHGDQLSNDQIEAVLEFLPIFQDDSFLPVIGQTWNPDPSYMRHPIWNPVVYQFQGALSANGFVEPFDWPSWQDEAESYFNMPEKLSTADVSILRKLFTLHVRKERFCEGHFAGMIHSGHIRLMLERLKDIRDFSEPSPKLTQDK